MHVTFNKHETLVNTVNTTKVNSVLYWNISPLNLFFETLRNHTGPVTIIHRHSPNISKYTIVILLLRRIQYADTFYTIGKVIHC